MMMMRLDQSPITPYQIPLHKHFGIFGFLWCYVNAFNCRLLTLLYLIEGLVWWD